MIEDNEAPETNEIPGSGATMVQGHQEDQDGDETPQIFGKQHKGKSAKSQKAQDSEKVNRETSSEKRKYTVKIDGKEEVMELDDKELQVYIQKGKASEKKFEEAAKLRMEAAQLQKEIEARRARLREETEKVLEEDGIDVDKLAEQRMLKRIERESMDPKDLELKELREKLTAKEQAEKKVEDDRKAKEKEEVDQKRHAALKDTFARKIMETLKDSDLPNNERTVGKIAAKMIAAAREKLHVDVQDIRDQVTKEYMEDFAHFAKNAEGPQIAKFLGEDVMKKLRHYEVSRVGNPTKPSPNGHAPQKTVQRQRYKTNDEINLEKYGTLYPALTVDDD